MRPSALPPDPDVSGDLSYCESLRHLSRVVDNSHELYPPNGAHEARSHLNIQEFYNFSCKHVG
eukprot:1367343-Amorphochlora_amoeboformis.AAC.1